ncbi:hypothetical protein B0H21DRAFT_884882, partial [Amylocystis lapponica]
MASQVPPVEPCHVAYHWHLIRMLHVPLADHARSAVARGQPHDAEPYETTYHYVYTGVILPDGKRVERKVEKVRQLLGGASDTEVSLAQEYLCLADIQARDFRYT